ncbi:MAG: hypothetical protein AB7S78_13085 [Candidatus Omnitrophota bacterium]
MKRIVLTMVVCAVFLLLPLTQVYSLDIKNQKVNITVSQSFVTRYIWRGLDLYPENDPSYQPSLDIAFEDLVAGIDVSLNIWGGLPIGSGHESSTEADYALTLSRDFEKINVSAGYVYFDYLKANRFSDVNELWVSASLFKIPVLPVDVSFDVLAAYEYKATEGGPDNGWYYSWGFSTTVPIPKCGLTQDGQGLDASVANWGNDGASDLKPSKLYATEFNLGTTYTFGSVSVTPGFTYVWNHEDEINPDNEIVGMIDISYSF